MLACSGIIATPALSLECEYRAGGDFELTAVPAGDGYDITQRIEGQDEAVDHCRFVVIGSGVERGTQAACDNAGTGWVLFSGPTYEQPEGKNIMVLANSVFFLVCEPDNSPLELGLGN